MGYSGTSTSYRVYNKSSTIIMESVNIVFDDMTSITWEQWESDEDTEKEEPMASDKTPEVSEIEDADVAPQQAIQQVHRNHSFSDVIGGVEEGRDTRGKIINFREMVQFACFVSAIEPKTHDEALRDKYWIISMEEELEQFTRNDVWELVARPDGVNIVGTKWIFKNKTDEHGEVVRNKARLLAQGVGTEIRTVDFGLN